jgi:sugar lactone lactonase YvrE
LLFLALLAACAKDALWNQDSEIPDSKKGTILGQLINEEDGKPLKGIKILFERQTSADGGQSYIDTLSTDTEGKFSYKVPFPNKVRLVVRDTGRYMADTAAVEVLEQKNYNVAMNSHPRFGVSSFVVSVVDENTQPITGEGERLKVGLFVRESSDENYSLVEDKVIDTDGKVVFENVAFPVQYKIALIGNEYAYDLSATEGKLLTKDPLNITLQSKLNFAIGDITLVAKYFFTDEVAADIPVKIYTKSVFDTEFVLREVVLDANGKITLPNLEYPLTVRIQPQTSVLYQFSNIELIVTADNASAPIEILLYDNPPRYGDITPSSVMSDNTLVAFYGDDIAIQEMEVDSKGNIYAVTTDGKLVRISYDGSGHKVMATGLTSPWGIAIQDDYTMYIMENTSGNRIKKVVIDPEMDVATITLFAGSPDGATGTSDGVGTEATFNRPGDAVYDPSRNCLWVVEWTNARIRKVDVETAQVTTLATGTGYGFGVGLTNDYKYLYIASHTSPAGIVKYDIENKQMYTVRTGYSIRHIAVAPNDDVYFNINGNYQGKQYKVTNEVLVSGNGGNTSSTFETIVGNGSWGALPAIGYSGSANISVGTGNLDGYVLLSLSR